MSDVPEPSVAFLMRVASPDRLAFQLRKGEQGLSVFDPDGSEPPLTEEEILDAFCLGSVVVYRTHTQIKGLGLEIVICEGAEMLPERLRVAHREIRPRAGMNRSSFKTAIKELE